MYEQFLKFSKESDDVSLYFLCGKISVNLGVNTADTLYVVAGMKLKLTYTVCDTNVLHGKVRKYAAQVNLTSPVQPNRD